ncbi:hypothetical protein [Pontibacterium sp.]|uniref:hypothetical protein n=1 Tax=Pontibacterium sp. TaxID=2036026 RepID=UPI003569B05B
MIHSNVSGYVHEAGTGMSTHCDAVLRDSASIHAMKARGADADVAATSEKDVRETGRSATSAYYSQWVRR